MCNPDPSDRQSQIVVVHGGAGFHPRSHISEKETKRVLRLACAHALAALDRKETALQASTEAIAVLEDEECLNAGYGSNLTMSGTVECDASIMDGRNRDFGAVGAVSGVKNPITLAHSVLQYARAPDPLGRIAPLLLVSAGAEQFAHTRVVTCPPGSLVSPRAQREWQRWKDALETAHQTPLTSTTYGIADEATSRPPHVDGLHDRQDTVGAIALGAQGNLAAGVSSGGLLLKLPGRVGEAAIYGAGCWATHRIACSVSGAGEYITRASLAKSICEALEGAGDDRDTHQILQTVLGQQFWSICAKRGETFPQAGVILLMKEHDDEGLFKRMSDSTSLPGRSLTRPDSLARLWCAFTTESMAIGYASSSSPKPSATILRRPARPSGETPSVYIAALPLDR
ncbi:N-terminal nucleophile aminohydrolase [Trametes polyzona]|nr:N-terminal nucleophile aminohydrolase [Trametes polyzona]